MSGVRRLEHVALRVTDIDAAVEFYEDVLGLVVLDSDDSTAYLSCGADGNFDLAVVEGGTGVDHFAVRAGEQSVREQEATLSDRGVKTERIGGTEPGVERGVRFDLPSDRLTVEVVDVEDSGYHHPVSVSGLPTVADGDSDRSPFAPTDLSHITAMSPAVEDDVEFLRDTLSFRVSDVGTSPTGEWVMTFLRSGSYHHDVAVFDDPTQSLHHVAWEVPDVSAMVRLLDHLATHGVELEAGPVRHGPGANIAAYFEEPGGNRFELTTEVATVDPDAPLEFHDVAEVPFSVWGGQEPDASFREGT